MAAFRITYTTCNLVLCLCCFAVMQAAAQISPVVFGELLPAGASGVRFHQELNSYVWQFGIAQQFHWRQKWQFTVQELFKTSMLRLGANQDKWKDEQNLTGVVRFRLLPALQLYSQASSLTFFDKQSGLNNNVRGYSAGIGMQFTPNRHINLKGGAGPRWEMRLSQRDYGYYYAFDAAAEDVELAGYHNRANMTLAMDDYRRRINHDAQLSYSVAKSFIHGTGDSLRFFFDNRRRDNYTSESGDIESLREGNKGFENVLKYSLNSWVKLSLRNSLALRNVELYSFSNGLTQRHRKRNDEISDHNLIFDLQQHHWYARFNLSYLMQVQKYDITQGDSHLPFSQRTAFITPDNESDRLFLGSEAAATISRKDSVFWYGSISRFQYNTPDTNNFDDRDELRINSKLIWAHSFRPSLRGELQASVNLYHMVYIFGERSADNNWNRIIRLRPVLHFSPGHNFRWFQSFEVLANYVDYDFEVNNLKTKSFVFRKFSYDDSLRVVLSRRTVIRIDYRLQLEENGQLYWEKWKEQLLTTRNSHWLQARFDFLLSPVFRWSPGYSFYIRDEWRYETDASGAMRKKKYQSFASHGPMVGVFYTPSRRIRIVLDAICRKVLPFQQKNYFINTFDVRVDWLF